MRALTNHDYYIPTQHHDGTFSHHGRILLRGARPFEGSFGITEPSSLTEGPITGWLLVDTEDNTKSPRQWMQGAPVTARELADAGWSPRLRDWSTESPLKVPLLAERPFDLEYPGGYPGVVHAGLDMDSQRELVAPAWAGLVCPSYHGRLPIASAVWDCTADDKIDETGYAPLNSAWMVYKRPENSGLFGNADPKKYRGLAWHLGIGGAGAEGVAGLGMCVDGGFGGQVFGAAAGIVGGPLIVGSPTDQHPIGNTGDGDRINALHIGVNALRIRDDLSGDGPERDDGEYVPCVGGPLLVETYWRFDSEAQHTWALGTGKGQWRHQSASFLAIIPPLDPPLPPPTDELPPPPGTIFVPNPEDFSGPFYTPPTGAPTAPTLADRFEEPVAIASSVGEIGLRGLVLRASGDFDSRSSSAIDQRARFDPLDDERRAEWVNAPSVLRIDVHADYRQDYKGRYQHQAPGVAWLMPSDTTLERALDGDEPTVTGSRYLGLHDVRFAWGDPLENGGVANGYAQYISGNALNTYGVNGSGTESQLLSLDRLTSTYTITPNTTISGQLTAHKYNWLYLEKSASYNHTSDERRALIGMKTTAAAAATTVTIDAPGDAFGPVIVADVDGDAHLYPITVTAGGSCNLGNATTYVINRPYGSVHLVPYSNTEEGWAVGGVYEPEKCYDVSGSQTAVAGGTYIYDVSSGTGELTLPASTTGRVKDGDIVRVKDGSNNAASNNISIVASGSDTIDGSSTATISTNRGYRYLQLCGTDWAVLSSA